jgi:hypothetical protein
MFLMKILKPSRAWRSARTSAVHVSLSSDEIVKQQVEQITASATERQAKIVRHRRKQIPAKAEIRRKPILLAP